MTQEEKQLLLITLCGMLPYGVKFTLSSDNIYTMKGIDLIVTDEGDWEYAITSKGIAPIEIMYVKPYLRSMSSMTEEEKKEYDKFYFIAPGQHLAVFRKNCERRTDWLNAHHFDYRGLIEKSLAIVAPEDMYKYEND